MFKGYKPIFEGLKTFIFHGFWGPKVGGFNICFIFNPILEGFHDATWHMRIFSNWVGLTTN